MVSERQPKQLILCTLIFFLVTTLPSQSDVVPAPLKALMTFNDVLETNKFRHNTTNSLQEIDKKLTSLVSATNQLPKTIQDLLSDHQAIVFASELSGYIRLFSEVRDENKDSICPYEKLDALDFFNAFRNFTFKITSYPPNVAHAINVISAHQFEAQVSNICSHRFGSQDIQKKYNFFYKTALSPDSKLLKRLDELRVEQTSASLDFWLATREGVNLDEDEKNKLLKNFLNYFKDYPIFDATFEYIDESRKASQSLTGHSQYHDYGVWFCFTWEARSGFVQFETPYVKGFEYSVRYVEVKTRYENIGDYYFLDTQVHMATNNIEYGKITTDVEPFYDKNGNFSCERVYEMAAFWNYGLSQAKKQYEVFHKKLSLAIIPYKETYNRTGLEVRNIKSIIGEIENIYTNK